MFNLKQIKKMSQNVYENYNRQKPLGPQANDNASINEKTLPHRVGYDSKTTENQMSSKHEWTDKKDAKISEKQLNDTSGSKYIRHRNDVSDLTMPPINILVETIRQKRLAEDYKVNKKSHWSHSFDEKKQQASLPKWKKNVPQHNKLVLNNDSNRFLASDNPVAKQSIQPLVGDITIADIHRVADGIKTGKVTEYNNAIMAILRLAHDEHRELTNVERDTIVNLKIARTNKLLQKNA